MKDKKISLSTAILLNMNIMIGSGILIGPGVSAAISGNASFLAWPLVALMFLPIVLCLVELSRMFPGAGGFYLYAKEGLGKDAGYLSGWLYIVGYTFAATVEVLALRQTIATTLSGTGFEMIVSNPILFNAALVAFCVIFGLLSLKIIGSFLNSLTIAKILPLVILILLLPFILNPSFSVSAHELSLLPASLAMPIFGYFGFEYCASVAHLIENPEKNAPKAIMIGFLATAALYTLFHFGLLNLMGADTLGSLGAGGAAAFPDYLTLPIPYLKSLLAILIPAAACITLFAGTLGMINANAILIHTMAEERLFKNAGFLLPVTSLGRPWVTLLIQGIIVFLLATLIPSISLIGGLCIFGVFLSFILPIASLIKVRKNRGIKTRLPIPQWALITVIGLSLYSCYTLDKFSYVFVLLAAILLGVVIYNRNRK